jgi:hypothetical protein
MAKNSRYLSDREMDRREFLSTGTKIIGTASLLSIGVFQGCGDDENPVSSGDGYD